MGGGLTKPLKIAEAVGHGIKGDRKGGINSVVPGSDVQGGDAVGAIIWQQDLGGDRWDAQGPDRVPPLCGATDHRDDGETRGRRRVGVLIGREGYGSCGDPNHWGVHQEAVDDHSIEDVLPPCICTVHGGRADARGDPVSAMVRSRRSK